jgi:hypothetical protein
LNILNLHISVSTPIQSVLTPKINNGQRFVCTCGRSFAAELTIHETTNVETSSPPATPMLSMKTDLKHQQRSQEPIPKRSKILMIEPSTSLIPTTTTTTLIDRSHPSTMLTNWQTPHIKNYGDSPGFIFFYLLLFLRKILFLELMTVESTRGESDIELSSDESRCLEDIDAVLSPDKTSASNFIYANSLWSTSLSPSTNGCLSYSTHNHHEDHRQHHHHHHQHQHQQQMITLKPVNSEPLSPTPTLVHDGESSKQVATIHRRPMLVAFTDSEAGSPTGPTLFKCTQCHETFDSLLLGQEHANNGMCTPDTTVNVCPKFNFFMIKNFMKYNKDKIVINTVLIGWKYETIFDILVII